MKYDISIITKSRDLPPLPGSDFFHGKDLFVIIEKTPLHKPYMLIAKDEDGNIVAHMLGVIRRKSTWFPPFIISSGRIYGEGYYSDKCDKQELFGLFLETITRIFRRSLCLYYEISDLSTKMFGYGHLRENGYFPINWQEIHNSFSEGTPDELLSTKMRKNVELSKQKKIDTRHVFESDEIKDSYRLTKKYFRFKVRRQTPPEKQFIQLAQSAHSKLFATFAKDKMIASAVCVYSNDKAYLWILASKRKSYYSFHPDAAIVWHVINDAYDNDIQQVCFFDAGLPIKYNSYREFILGFGGKPVTKYRWFNINIPWINRIAHWFFNS